MGSILFGQIISKFKKINLRDYYSKNVGATNAIRVLGKKYGILIFLFDFVKGWIAVLIASVILNQIVINFPEVRYLTKYGFLIYLAGFFSVIGHIVPISFFYIWIKYRNLKLAWNYKGGKGVSTSAGLVASISPWMFIVIFIIFWSSFLLFGYVSFSSLLTTFFIPFLGLIPILNYFYITDINQQLILNFPSIDQAYLVQNVINYENNLAYLITVVVILSVVALLIFLLHKQNIARLINKNENQLLKNTLWHMIQNKLCKSKQIKPNKSKQIKPN